MRCFASALLACLLAVAPAGRAPLYAQGNPTPEQKPATAFPENEVPGPFTIAVIGDSLGDGLWQGLYRQLRGNKRIVVFRGSKRSVGFTTSDMTEQIDAAFAAGPVDALVVMIGANDDRRSFFAKGISLALFASPKWAELYRGRVEGFMDHAAGRKVPFVWVRQRLASTTIQYVSLRDAQICQPAMRARDGQHFTNAGNRYVWEKVRRDSTYAATIELPKRPAPVATKAKARPKRQAQEKGSAEKD